MAYAEKTTVPFEKSIADIIGLLRQAEADEIGQMEARGAFTLQFAIADRVVRFRVQFPSSDELAKLTGPRQDPRQVAEQWRRQRGRALLLVVKAKLESVESGVETFEQAFLANVVLADGRTLYERVQEPIAIEYRTLATTTMLLAGSAA